MSSLSKKIYTTRILTLLESCTVLTNTGADLDKIVSRELTRELRNYHFNPVTSPELKAKRSVILIRLDEHIYSQNENDIKEEFAHHNTWITKEDISEIYKYPNSNVTKWKNITQATVI